MNEGVRPRLLYFCHWYVEHKDKVFYEEVRPMPLGARLPQYNDCAGTFTNIYYLAGGRDPNGFDFNGYGNTTSLAQHGQRISLEQVRIGDAVIFYEGGFNPYDSVHVAMIVGNTGEHLANPLTMSHGDSAQPAFVTVNDDGRPHRYFRFPVNKRN